MMIFLAVLGQETGETVLDEHSYAQVEAVRGIRGPTTPTAHMNLYKHI
jgi:hypothetical protein